MGKIQRGDRIVLIQSSFIDLLKTGQLRYLISLTTKKEFDEEFKRLSKECSVEEVTILGNPDFFIAGMVIDPVAITFPGPLPDKAPINELAITAA